MGALRSILYGLLWPPKSQTPVSHLLQRLLTGTAHLQSKPQERWVMTAEKFLMPDPKPPLDEEEIREAVWELLFSRAPPALVRVVGKQVYHRY